MPGLIDYNPEISSTGEIRAYDRADSTEISIVQQFLRMVFKQALSISKSKLTKGLMDISKPIKRIIPSIEPIKSDDALLNDTVPDFPNIEPQSTRSGHPESDGFVPQTVAIAIKLKDILKNNSIIFLLLILPSLIAFILSNYGLDIADSGWAAVVTRDYFSSPEIAAQASPWFFTWLIGAFLTQNDQNQVSALRDIAYLPIFTASLATWISFYVAGFKNWKTALGIAIAGLASYSAFGLNYLNYNSLSASFATVAFACIFLKGHGKNSKTSRILLIFLAGTFFSLSVMSRFASITMLIPCLYLILIYSYSRKSIIADGIIFASGIFTGIFGVGCITYSSGHLTYLIQNLISFFQSSIGSGGESSHPVSLLLKTYFSTFLTALIQASIFVIAVVYSHAQLVVRKYLILPFAFICVAFVVGESRINFYQVFIIVILILLIGVRSSPNMPRSMKPYAITGILFAFLFPLGSTNGLANSCFAMWFLVPTILCVTENKVGRAVIGVSSSICVAILLANTFWNPYWDSRISKLECNLASKYAKNIKTTCARSKVLGEVIEVIEKHTTHNKSILVYQNSPMIYMLSGTVPWIKFPWPYLISSDRLEEEIKTKQKTSLPKLIVRDKQSTFGKQWPDSEKLPMQSIRSTPKSITTYDNLVEEHHYHLVFENSMFQVLAQ